MKIDIPVPLTSNEEEWSFGLLSRWAKQLGHISGFVYLEYQQPVAVSPHASGYYTFERFIADVCSRDVIFELRCVRCEPSAEMRSAYVERAGCGGTCRGRRAGKHVNARRHCVAYSETSDGEIPVLSTTCRRRSNSSSGRVGDRDRRDGVLRRVTTHSTTTDMAVNGERTAAHPFFSRLPTIDLRHQRSSHHRTARRPTTVNNRHQ